MFTLLIKKTENPKMKEFFEKMLSNGHDCEKCAIKDECPILRIPLIAEEWLSSKDDDLNEIKKIIKEKFETAALIIVMDDVEDICYLFKAEGELPDIKKTVLKDALITYERIIETHVFFSEIRDVRGEPITVEEKESSPAAQGK